MTKQETIKEEAKKRWGNVHRTGVLGFIDGVNWCEENESKKEIDFNKLRDEFFAECTDGGDNFTKVVSLAPHDMFEWFKKKING